jgi:hypothetical protein
MTTLTQSIHTGSANIPGKLEKGGARSGVDFKVCLLYVCLSVCLSVWLTLTPTLTLTTRNIITAH